MDIYKFLATNTAELPKRQNQPESFPIFLKKQFDGFIKELPEQLAGEVDWLSRKR